MNSNEKSKKVKEDKKETEPAQKVSSSSEIRFLVESFYDEQKRRIQAGGNILAFVKSHEDLFRDELELASKTMREKNKTGEPKKYAEVAKWIVHGDIPTPKPIADLVEFYRKVYGTEEWLNGRLDDWSAEEQIRIRYLSKIYGIGSILSSDIIAWLQPISRWDSPSKVISYSGLSSEHYECDCNAKKKPHHFQCSKPPKFCPILVGKKRKPCGAKIMRNELVKSPPKMKHGYLFMYNKKMRTLWWKVTASFIKQSAEKSHYRQRYDTLKEEAYNSKPYLREPIEKGKQKGAKLHLDLYARRKLAKEFIKNLWFIWRIIEHLPANLPYEVQYLGHTYHPPVTDKAPLDPELQKAINEWLKNQMRNLNREKNANRSEGVSHQTHVTQRGHVSRKVDVTHNEPANQKDTKEDPDKVPEFGEDNIEDKDELGDFEE